MNTKLPFYKNKFTFSKLIMHVIMIGICLFCTLPLILVVAISFTDNNHIVTNGYSFFPSKVSINAYRYVFLNVDQILRSYGITLFTSIVGTIVSMWLTVSIAYVMSRKDYRLSNPISFYVFFTMLINAGVVPWYILIVNYLNMKDTIWVLFVPYLVIGWHVLLMKGFLKVIPTAVIESAKIDGASEYMIFLRIIIPMAQSGIATVALFNVLVFWNDWWLSLLFIDQNKLVSLQYLLVRIMNNVEFLMSGAASAGGRTIALDTLPSMSARMALCVVAAGPMLLLFPFFQEFFVKGIVVGSVKG